jgi:hypothetical protein
MTNNLHIIHIYWWKFKPRVPFPSTNPKFSVPFNSGSQTFDEDWWTMLIASGTEWTLNQSYEFKVINSLTTPWSKTKDEHCWYFVPCINIKEDEATYAFNRILVQHGAKLKWETRRMGWCWFSSLNVYRMTLVFFPLV